ncbi:MAG: DUF721 domain-containing protein [Thioalkalispiraceae bacterium]|jgi:hypothetical protein
MKLSRSVDKVLQQADSELAILVTRTRKLRALTEAFRSLLEPELAAHCYIGNIERERLTVMVDSAAWASKFRFLSQSILPALNNLDHIFSEVKQIQVKILYQSPEQPAPHYQRPELNEKNAEGLLTLAEAVDDDNLQAALTRLAKKAKPGN